MIPILIAGIGGVIVLLMSVTAMGGIQCDTISNEELQEDCEDAKNTAWIVVGLLPFVLFIATFRLFTGSTASMGALSIENIEERAKKMQELGVDHIIRKTHGKIIDRSKRGNELYELGLIPNYPLKYLKYEDPSTPNKIYGCFVPTEMKSADEAMGWKFYITEDEYQNELLYES